MFPLYPLREQVDKKGYMFYALYMPAIEELEQRIARLETFYEDVLKEKINYIISRLDRLDSRLDQLYEKTERDKSEFLAKTDRDKRELIYWMVGLLLGFSTLTITAIWAILSFALK